MYNLIVHINEHLIDYMGEQMNKTNDELAHDILCDYMNGYITYDEYHELMHTLKQSIELTQQMYNYLVCVD